MANNMENNEPSIVKVDLVCPTVKSKLEIQTFGFDLSALNTDVLNAQIQDFLTQAIFQVAQQSNPQYAKTIAEHTKFDMSCKVVCK